MDLKCERTKNEEIDTTKEVNKTKNQSSPANNNSTKDSAVFSLVDKLQERLIIKPNENGLVNGTSNDSSRCCVKVKSSNDESEEFSNLSNKPDGLSLHMVQDNIHSETTTSNKILDIEYVGYESEIQMPDIMRLIQKDLSEPYSIYTYRYFIHNWPKLCFLAMHQNVCIGAIVCKLDAHRKISKRGYIAMLAVDEKYRKQKIGSTLVKLAIEGMVTDKADEVVLETEITNQPALRLYENLGFVRDKRLFRYYLNGVDALRLKLWLR